MGTNISLEPGMPFVGPMMTTIASIPLMFAGEIGVAGGGSASTGLKFLAPAGLGVVGAYLGYTGRIPVLRDYV